MATTNRGSYPYNTGGWTGSRYTRYGAISGASLLLRRTLTFGDGDSSRGTTWRDWLFPAAVQGEVSLRRVHRRTWHRNQN